MFPISFLQLRWCRLNYQTPNCKQALRKCPIFDSSPRSLSPSSPHTHAHSSSLHLISPSISIPPYSRIMALIQAINVLHAHTLELRGLNPEKSAHALLSLMQMFEGRIQTVRLCCSTSSLAMWLWFGSYRSPYKVSRPFKSQKISRWKFKISGSIVSLISCDTNLLFSLSLLSIFLRLHLFYFILSPSTSISLLSPFATAS